VMAILIVSGLTDRCIFNAAERSRAQCAIEAGKLNSNARKQC
jgi:hypothetical protein